MKKMKLRKVRKKWIAGGVVLCILVVAVVVKIRSGRSERMGTKGNRQMEAVVTAGTIQTSVSGAGTISYADSMEIVLPSDLIIDEMLAGEGSFVTEGDLLATVDEASLAACLNEVEEAIGEADSTISAESSSSSGQSIKAGVAGRVKKIYAEKDDSVADVMREQGALMLLSVDGLMAVELTDAGNLKTGDKVEVGSGDTKKEGTVESVDSDGAVITFADSAFDYGEEVTVADEEGKELGKGKAYIHQMIQVVGSSGTISSLHVSVNSSVSASTKVYTLDSSTKSAEYMRAVKEREGLVSLLDTLISIQADGGIVADTDGMVETVNITSSARTGASNQASSNMEFTADGNGESGKSMAEKESSTGEEIAAEMISDSGKEPEPSEKTQTISGTVKQTSGFMTMSYAEEAGETDASKVVRTSVTMPGNATASQNAAVVGNVTTPKNMATPENMTVPENTAAPENVTVPENTPAPENTTAPQNVTGGAGVINGTTAAMEYAADGNADNWTACTEGSTKVAAGTWYVRYRASDGANASPAVKVTVTQENTGEQDKGQNKEPGSPDTSSAPSKEENANGAKDTTAGTNEKQTGKADTNAPGNTSSGQNKSTGSSSGSGYVNTSASASSGSGSSDSVETVSAFVIATGNQMKVTMNVDELDIGSMKEGMSAEITLDAVEGETFTGEITNVSGSAGTGDGVAQYPVEITFERTGDMLSGMNASVAVIVEEADNVLTLPLIAVTDMGVKAYVYTGYDESSGELTGQKEVTLGLSDENNVEIISGLSVGDKVYYQMMGSQDGSNAGNGMGGFMNGMGGMRENIPGGDAPNGGRGQFRNGDGTGNGGMRGGAPQ